MPWRFRVLALIFCATCSVAMAEETSMAPEEDLIAGPPAGPWRRLFLDAMVVEDQQGLERVFHTTETLLDKLRGGAVGQTALPALEQAREAAALAARDRANDPRAGAL